MYDADPFAARKAVDERQAKATQRREDRATPSDKPNAAGQTSPEFANAPEAKMASGLRDIVEQSIKKVSCLVINSFMFIRSYLFRHCRCILKREMEVIPLFFPVRTFHHFNSNWGI